MTNSFQIQGEKDLAKLDRIVGKSATYYTSTGSSLAADGTITNTYSETTGITVRAKKLTSSDVLRLSELGFGRIDAVWKLRHSYIADVKPGHVIGVDGAYYQVVEDGATLDILELLWTILTRRRP